MEVQTAILRGLAVIPARRLRRKRRPGSRLSSEQRIEMGPRKLSSSTVTVNIEGIVVGLCDMGKEVYVFATMWDKGATG